jgi:hypothetical protein
VEVVRHNLTGVLDVSLSTPSLSTVLGPYLPLDDQAGDWSRSPVLDLNEKLPYVL